MHISRHTEYRYMYYLLVDGSCHSLHFSPIFSFRNHGQF